MSDNLVGLDQLPLHVKT